jgi:23S rRNA (cytidine1920-2'-O)/16S rRNA (cytidine1409-2'-O)-methyltransferase
MNTSSQNEALRADVFLVEHGYAKSKTEAQSAIRSGHVRINGQVVHKPSHQMAPNSSVEYVKPHPYVSRGALKLAAALDHFELTPSGLVCVDIGSSTGGFTEILLERDARRVYAVDVGHGQLAAKLKRDPRVTTREGINARDLSAEHVPEAPQAIVADVSFVGLKQALPPVLAMAAGGAWLVALIKPQFEVGRYAVGKGGDDRDAEAQHAALSDISNWLNGISGWDVLGMLESPIQAGDGNREYLVAAKKA